jgi:hypothetical protein
LLIRCARVGTWSAIPTLDLVRVTKCGGNKGKSRNDNLHDFNCVMIRRTSGRRKIVEWTSLFGFRDWKVYFIVEIFRL